MNKNVLNLIYGLSIILFTTTSCEKDWLDVTSNTQIRAEEQFETEDGYRDALMGVYIGMTAPELYSKDMTWNLVDLLSQQYETLPSLAVYDEVQQFNYDAVNATEQIDNLWEHSYNVIANINVALDFIEGNQVLHPIDHSIIKGELLALRVFLHFDLLRLYGVGNLENRNPSGAYAIPYVTEYDNSVTPQLPYEETFQKMEADLEEALTLLQEDPIYPATDRDENYYTEVNREGFYNNREQRMNYYAAKALQARLNLWQGGAEDMEQARLAAEEVIQNAPFNLVNSENYPVSSDPILYPEVLFSLDITGFADIVNPFLDASTGTNYDALFFAPSNAAEIFETSNVNIGVADVRYNTLLSNQSRGMVSIKLLQENGNNHSQMPLIKLPEMYYIAAEAYLENNQKEKAIELLNTVRASRGIIQEIPMDSTPEEVEAELLKEYRKEFISEGQLFFYYKRNGFEQIPGLSETIILDDEVYVLPYPENEVEFGNR